MQIAEADLPGFEAHAGPAGLAGVQSLPIPDPVGGITGLVGDQLATSVVGLLRRVAGDFLDGLAEPVLTYVLHTPDLLAEPTLRQLWLTSLACLYVLAGLLVVIAATALIPGSTGRLGQAAREALGVRLVAGLLTASVALPLVALEAELANRLVDTLVPAGLAGTSGPLWSALTRAVTGAPDAQLGLLVITLVGVVLLVTITVLGLARWATLWLLIALAPLAMGFATLPGGAGVARAWWRLQLAAVFLPLAHAVLLGAYVAMFSSERNPFIGSLAGVAVLGLMAKLPGWAAGQAAGIGAHDIGGRIRYGAHRARRAVVVASAVGTGGASGAAAAGTSALGRASYGAAAAGTRAAGRAAGGGPSRGGDRY